MAPVVTKISILFFSKNIILFLSIYKGTSKNGMKSSRHSSMVSKGACYQQGYRFRSWQGREAVILNKNELLIQIYRLIVYYGPFMFT